MSGHIGVPPGGAFTPTGDAGIGLDLYKGGIEALEFQTPTG